MHVAKFLIDKATWTLFLQSVLRLRNRFGSRLNMCKNYLITLGENSWHCATMQNQISSEKISREIQVWNATQTIVVEREVNRGAAFNHNKNEETVAFLVGSCRLAQFPNMPGNVYHVCGEHSRKLCESICIKAARFTSRRFQAVHWFECFRCTPEVIQSRLDA